VRRRPATAGFPGDAMRTTRPIATLALCSMVALGAALNLSTYVVLYTYGYRNVWEPGPLVDARATRIEFASAGAADSAGR
jgi:hypothetical protein